jgi:hypothetical protein
MTIEISPKEYWKVMCRDEAQLYCLFLDIDGKRGWRFPKSDELSHHIMWYKEDLNNPDLGDPDDLYPIVPVRDRKDDD